MPAIVRFHCPFVGLCGCQDGGGKGLVRTSLLTHLRDRHFNGNAQVTTRRALSTSESIFAEAELTFKCMGIWLCGDCFKTHTFRSKCGHGGRSASVPPPDEGDGVVRFIRFASSEGSVISAFRCWGCCV
ncbi:hypothetical protein vseg_003724 [Gypsophila vaccaria]